MEDWQPFDDLRFALRFDYPPLASDGEPVERIETQQPGMLRAHILAPLSREVYFEITKYQGLSPEDEYQRHSEYLPRQFGKVRISDRRDRRFASLQAFEYTFEWEQGKRMVLLAEHYDATYRILYNPLFPVNLRILSTVEWLSFP